MHLGKMQADYDSPQTGQIYLILNKSNLMYNWPSSCAMQINSISQDADRTVKREAILNIVCNGVSHVAPVSTQDSYHSHSVRFTDSD